MSEHSNTTKYIEAMARYNSAAEKLKGVVSTVRKVSNLLYSQPIRFLFSNLAQGVGMMALSPTATTVDAKTWPSAEEIQSALAASCEAHKELLSIWRSLSREEQEPMRPPPAATVQG